MANERERKIYQIIARIDEQLRELRTIPETAQNTQLLNNQRALRAKQRSMFDPKNTNPPLTHQQALFLIDTQQSILNDQLLREQDKIDKELGEINSRKASVFGGLFSGVFSTPTKEEQALAKKREEDRIREQQLLAEKEKLTKKIEQNNTWIAELKSETNYYLKFITEPMQPKETQAASSEGWGFPDLNLTGVMSSITGGTTPKTPTPKVTPVAAPPPQIRTLTNQQRLEIEKAFNFLHANRAHSESDIKAVESFIAIETLYNKLPTDIGDQGFTINIAGSDRALKNFHEFHNDVVKNYQGDVIGILKKELKSKVKALNDVNTLEKAQQLSQEIDRLKSLFTELDKLKHINSFNKTSIETDFTTAESKLKQLEEAKKQADETQRQAEEAKRREAEEAQRQVEEVNREAEARAAQESAINALNKRIADEESKLTAEIRETFTNTANIPDAEEDRALRIDEIEVNLEEKIFNLNNSLNNDKDLLKYEDSPEYRQIEETINALDIKLRNFLKSTKAAALAVQPTPAATESADAESATKEVRDENDLAIIKLQIQQNLDSLRLAYINYLDLFLNKESLQTKQQEIKSLTNNIERKQNEYIACKKIVDHSLANDKDILDSLQKELSSDYQSAAKALLQITYCANLLALASAYEKDPLDEKEITSLEEKIETDIARYKESAKDNTDSNAIAEELYNKAGLAKETYDAALERVTERIKQQKAKQPAVEELLPGAEESIDLTQQFDTLAAQIASGKSVLSEEIRREFNQTATIEDVKKRAEAVAKSRSELDTKIGILIDVLNADNIALAVISQNDAKYREISGDIETLRIDLATLLDTLAKAAAPAVEMKLNEEYIKIIQDNYKKLVALHSNAVNGIIVLESNDIETARELQETIIEASEKLKEENVKIKIHDNLPEKPLKEIVGTSETILATLKAKKDEPVIKEINEIYKNFSEQCKLFESNKSILARQTIQKTMQSQLAQLNKLFANLTDQDVKITIPYVITGDISTLKKHLAELSSSLPKLAPTIEVDSSAQLMNISDENITTFLTIYDQLMGEIYRSNIPDKTIMPSVRLDKINKLYEELEAKSKVLPDLPFKIGDEIITNKEALLKEAKNERALCAIKILYKELLDRKISPDKRKISTEKERDGNIIMQELEKAYGQLSDKNIQIPGMKIEIFSPDKILVVPNPPVKLLFEHANYVHLELPEARTKRFLVEYEKLSQIDKTNPSELTEKDIQTATALVRTLTFIHQNLTKYNPQELNKPIETTDDTIDKLFQQAKQIPETLRKRLADRPINNFLAAVSAYDQYTNEHTDITQQDLLEIKKLYQVILDCYKAIPAERVVVEVSFDNGLTTEPLVITPQKLFEDVKNEFTSRYDSDALLDNIKQQTNTLIKAFDELSNQILNGKKPEPEQEAAIVILMKALQEAESRYKTLADIPDSTLKTSSEILSSDYSKLEEAKLRYEANKDSADKRRTAVEELETQKTKLDQKLSEMQSRITPINLEIQSIKAELAPLTKQKSDIENKLKKDLDQNALDKEAVEKQIGYIAAETQRAQIKQKQDPSTPLSEDEVDAAVRKLQHEMTIRAVQLEDEAEDLRRYTSTLLQPIDKNIAELESRCTKLEKERAKLEAEKAIEDNFVWVCSELQELLYHTTSNYELKKTWLVNTRLPELIAELEKLAKESDYKEHAQEMLEKVKELREKYISIADKIHETFAGNVPPRIPEAVVPSSPPQEEPPRPVTIILTPPVSAPKVSLIEPKVGDILTEEKIKALTEEKGKAYFENWSEQLEAIRSKADITDNDVSKASSLIRCMIILKVNDITVTLHPSDKELAAELKDKKQIIDEKYAHYKMRQEINAFIKQLMDKCDVHIKLLKGKDKIGKNAVEQLIETITLLNNTIEKDNRLNSDDQKPLIDKRKEMHDELAQYLSNTKSDILKVTKHKVIRAVREVRSMVTGQDKQKLSRDELKALQKEFKERERSQTNGDNKPAPAPVAPKAKRNSVK